MKIIPIVLSDPFDEKEFDSREAFEFMKNGSADTIASSYKFTRKRAENFLFSDTIYKVRNGFITKEADNLQNSMWTFLEIFDLWTWIGLLIVLLLQCALCIIIQRTETVLRNKAPTSIFEVRLF